MLLSKRNRPIYMTIILVVVLMGSLLAVVGRTKNRPTDTPVKIVAGISKEHPIDIAVAKVTTQPITNAIQTTGSLIADESSDVAAEVSGQIASTPVNIGTFVAKGDVIARLNDRNAQLQLMQARTNEQQAIAALKQAQAKLGMGGVEGSFNASQVPEVLAAQNSLESAQAKARLAQAETRRYELLVQSGVVSRSEYDRVLTQSQTAEAEVNVARRQYDIAVNGARQSNQGIAREQASLEGARVQVAIAEKALADTIIKAPFAGYISDRPVAVGEYVNTGAKIATILRTQTIKLHAQLPEAEVASVHVGMNINASVEGYPDKLFSGTITAINPAVDVNARTLTVEANINNTDNLLRAGMFATVRIEQPGNDTGIFIPLTAFSAQSNNSANSTAAQVFVIEGDTVHVRVVQLGERKDDRVRVINGLKANDTLAINNLSQLFDGAIVRTK